MCTSRRYTSHYNVVDYPAIAFPTGLKVDPELDVITPEEASSYVPLSEDDRVAHEGCESSAELHLPAPS